MTNVVGPIVEIDRVVNETAHHSLEYISGYKVCKKNLLRESNWLSSLQFEYTDSDTGRTRLGNYLGGKGRLWCTGLIKFPKGQCPTSVYFVPKKNQKEGLEQV